MSELRYIDADEDVYRAALALEKQAEEFDIPAFMLSELKEQKYRKKGDNTQAQFWKAVWNFEMTLECVSAGTLILINTAKS
jgi:hypothetical protein